MNPSVNYRTLFYLCFTAACLGLLLWLMERHEREEHTARAAPAALFPEFDPSRIIRLTLARDAWRIELERHEHEWRIVRPFSERANAERIHAILGFIERFPVLETLSHAEWSARDLSLGHFGLAEPRITLTLASAEREFVLRAGSESPLDHGLYVMTSGKPDVFLTDRLLLDRLPQSLDDLREHTLFHGMAADVARLDIKPYAGPYLQLSRAADGLWILQQPVTAGTERGAVRALLDHLLETRITEFLPETTGAILAAHGLEEGEAVVQLTVWKKGMDTGNVLLLGHPRPDHPDTVYARRGGNSAVFSLPRSLRDRLLLTANDLRDKKVFPIEPWTVTRVKLRASDRSVVLGLQDGGWHVTEPVQWKADDEITMETVVNICELRALRFEPTSSTNWAALGLDTAPYAVSVDVAGAKPMDPPARLLIGQRTPDGLEYFARRDGDPTVFTVAASQLDGRLIGTNSAGMPMTDPLAYRDRSVLSVPPESIWRVELQRGDTRQLVERDTDGNWQATHPAASRANLRQIQTLLETISELRALRIEYRGLEQTTAFGFDRPGWILTVHLAGAEGISKTLITGFRARTDAIFAMVQGRDLVFSIQREIIDRLGADLTLPPADTP